MRDHDIPESEFSTRRHELHSCLIGLAWSVGLTLAAFAVVWTGLVQGHDALFVLAGLAVVQMAVQLRYFLHIDTKKSHRDDLQLVLFTVLILFLMVGGSVWILFNQHAHMM